MARILVECGNALVAMDRVEALEAAGHVVTTCPGPAHHDCPVLHGDPCGSIADADVIISSLGDRTLGVVLATERIHPDKQILAVLTGPEVDGTTQILDNLTVIPPGIDDKALVAEVDDALARGGAS